MKPQHAGAGTTRRQTEESPLMLIDPDPGAVVQWPVSGPPSTCTAT